MDIAEKAWSQAEGLLTLFVLSCSSSRTRASASDIEAYLYIQLHIRIAARSDFYDNAVGSSLMEKVVNRACDTDLFLIQGKTAPGRPREYRTCEPVYIYRDGLWNIRAAR
ncbi:hypothetical protein BDV32DRAFT_132192 [Aspergillus pseudonomiae]|nr:hypothetical protein BDV32DRAFT_132192 [Aspergillus pseudonomiae]